MAETRSYLDRRAPFWKQWFEQGADYETYLAGSDPELADKWRALAGQIPPLGPDERSRLQGHRRILHALLYSGVWCGDCVRQGPMIRNIVEACGPGVDLRIVERAGAEELAEELRVLGGLRVPVLVLLSEDFFEIGRFGDRLLSAYRRRAALEFGPDARPGITPPTRDQLGTEQSEWADVFERALLMLRLSPMLRGRYGD